MGGGGWGRGGVDTERAGHVSRAVLVACLHVRHPLTSSHPTFRRVVTGGKVVGCVRWGRKKYSVQVHVHSERDFN